MVEETWALGFTTYAERARRLHPPHRYSAAVWRLRQINTAHKVNLVLPDRSCLERYIPSVS
jgi:hypothetical protein